jgi:hypothetical protein
MVPPHVSQGKRGMGVKRFYNSCIQRRGA